MLTLLQRHGRTAGALLLIAALAACPRDDRVEQEDAAEIGAEHEDVRVFADLNGHLAASLEAAEIARERATNPEVQQFAQTVEADHQQKQQQIANLMQQHGLIGVEPDSPGRIDDHVSDVRDLREKEQGEDFDRAYLDKAIDYHRTMIDRIDTVLDRTQHLEFSQALRDVRPTMEQHLRQAEDLRDRLDG